MISLRPEMKIDRDELIDRLVALQYRRSDIDFARSTFRARGDILEIFPPTIQTLPYAWNFWRYGGKAERI